MKKAIFIHYTQFILQKELSQSACHSIRQGLLSKSITISAGCICYHPKPSLSALALLSSNRSQRTCMEFKSHTVLPEGFYEWLLMQVDRNMAGLNWLLNSISKGCVTSDHASVFRLPNTVHQRGCGRVNGSDVSQHEWMMISALCWGYHKVIVGQQMDLHFHNQTEGICIYFAMS